MTESDGMFSAPSEATAITVIAGSIGGDTVQTVNARDLHAFLEVGKDFSNWVKARIEQYDFVENRDFVVFARSGENSSGGRPAKDYALAIQVRPKALFSYLREHNWIYRRPGGKSYLGYQTRVTSGLLEHKVTTVLRADGSEKIVEQVLITPRGLTKLAMLLQPIGAVVAAA